MESRIYNVNLQSGYNTLTYIGISQYDAGVPLQFNVYDGATAASFPAGTTATIMGVRPSGVGFSIACTLADNVVTVDTSTDMTGEAGKFPVEIRFTASGVDVGTVNFVFIIEKAPHPEGTIDADITHEQEFIDRLEALEEEIVTDKTLRIRDRAADAKATGDAIGTISEIISANLMGIDVQENLYSGAADWSGEWINTDPPVLKLSVETFMGYPVMHSAQVWRRFYKNIPVEAGKTYTFESWFRHATTGAAFIYLIFTNTASPATISVNSKQFTNVPADTWTKLSVTFTCSAAGNVSPFALSASSAFDIAKYNLVESDKVFSLADELDNKATVEDVNAIGDYHKYDFDIPAGTPSTTIGQYWNNEIEKSVPSGTKCKLVFDSYSGDYFNYVRIDGKKSGGTYDNNLAKITTPIKGANAEFTTAYDYIGFRVQFYRTTAESGITASVLVATSKDLGITNDLLSQRVQRVFTVEKDGSGDFTSFVDAINYACGFMDSIVYVGAGVYDLLDELGSDYIQNPSSDKKGLVLKNRVHVICSSQTVLEMNNTGTVLEYVSPINTGENGCTLENATIIDNGVRYSIHDDQGWMGDTPYTNKFINCTMIHKNGMYGDCIGGGLGENCDIEIRGCYLEGDSNVQRLAYYHGNNHTGITNAKGRITLCDNFFAGVGSFWVLKYGDSTEMTTAYVSNNSFGSAPQVKSDSYALQDNMQIVEWNNIIRN